MILLKPIENNDDYLEAQMQLSSIFHEKLNFEEAQKAEILSILIDNYERKINPPIENNDADISIDYIYDLVKNASQFNDNEIDKQSSDINKQSKDLSDLILKLNNSDNNKLNSDIKQDILLKSVNNLIMLFDIMSNVGFTKQQIFEMSENQINKWINRIKK